MNSKRTPAVVSLSRQRVDAVMDILRISVFFASSFSLEGFCRIICCQISVSGVRCQKTEGRRKRTEDRCLRPDFKAKQSRRQSKSQIPNPNDQNTKFETAGNLEGWEAGRLKSFSDFRIPTSEF
ncbi:MAG: hypothetical protein P8X90_06245, partial [Desulfobacterales bacterium]